MKAERKYRNRIPGHLLMTTVLCCLFVFIATRISTAGWTSYTTANGLAGDNVNCITADKDGIIWAATNANGLSKFDGTAWTTYDKLLTGGGIPSN
jgi:ligand-binding sensor domain-containing protein